MGLGLLGKWVKHYDPIHRGFTASGIANGLTATNGWSFPRILGGYNLYRGVGGPDSIDFSDAVGASQRGDVSISNFSWRGHDSSTRYSYAVTAVGGGGVESRGSSPELTAEFDAGGNLLGLRPNSPTEISVSPSAGGRFLVKWVYSSRLEEAGPAQFELYHDSGTGVVDYGAAVSQVAYRKGCAHFEYSSGAFAHGARVIWAVRAVTAGGVDDGNVLTAFEWADATAPVSHPLLRFSCLAEEDAIGS